MTEVDVAIVGAGVSGLAVADSLLRAGRPVQVFEARPTVGGRIRSAAVPDGTVDLGPTWFWPEESRVQRLMNELDLGFYEQWTTGDSLLVTDGSIRRLSYPVMPRSYRFTTGAVGLVDGLMGRIPPSAVKTDCPVLRIESGDDHVTIHTAEGSLNAAAAVIAIPPALAVSSGMINTKDLDPAVSHVASTIPTWMSSVVKAVAVFSEPFWRLAGLSGSAFAPGGSFTEIHDMSGPDGTPAMLFGFSHSTLSDPVQTFISELATLFGPRALSPTSTLVTDWSKEIFTAPTGHSSMLSYDLFGSAHLRTPSWQGRLHWTSTETSIVSPGHIEGALAAAERTVKDLLAQEGRP